MAPPPERACCSATYSWRSTASRLQAPRTRRRRWPRGAPARRSPASCCGPGRPRTSSLRSASGPRGGAQMSRAEARLGAVPRGLDRALTDVAERLTRITVRILGPRGATGSGVIWAAGGLVLTNAHVVHGPSDVVLSTGQRFAGRLVARDADADLAALAVGAGGLPAAEIGDARTLRVGEVVVAVGNPLGLDGALTTGVVHAMRGPRRAPRFIEADLRLLPGN